jgi:hypothetical protein
VLENAEICLQAKASRSEFVYGVDDPDDPDHILEPRSDVGEDSVVRMMTLQEIPDEPETPASDVQAFSLSMVVPASLSVTAALGPDAEDAEYEMFVFSTGCLSAGVIMEFDEPYDPANVLNALDPLEVLELTVSTVPADWLGVEDPAELEFPLDNCATPPVANVVVVGGESRDIANPDLVMIQKVAPVSQLEFVRGDANVDTKVDVGDAVFVLNWLFRDGATPSCLDAADANDDNAHDVTDVLYLISYVFQIVVERDEVVYEPQPPPPPFPLCGLDTTGGTAESCLSYPPCE